MTTPATSLAPQTGAELLVKSLEAQGVEHAFGIPQAKIDKVFDTLVDSRIKTVVCRHEQNANSEDDPVVAIGGAVPLADRLKLIHQSTDTIISRSITKVSAEIDSPAAVSEVVANAFRSAESGRPGAAWRVPMNGNEITIHIIDDDVSVREAVGCLIRSAGWKVEIFSSAEEFLLTSKKNIPSCLVLDVDLPGLNGLDLQEELAKTNVQIPIVFLTGHGDIPMTVRALKAGAVDFLTKPANEEDLLGAIREGVARGNLGRKSNERDGFEEIIGSSPMLMRVLEQIRTVGPTDSTVLILGETGTGKELIARAIHKCSKRSGHTFVSVNCAAVPRDLIASELFGHEKGAFTGALQQRLGRFELANSGTIFLDEIGELPAETQIALLRVLQEREFERVGGNRAIHTDVRVIAATNRDLPAAITAGTFREDLFYRLNVFPIEVPPLRTRKEDIPMLMEYFVKRFAEKMGKPIRKIDKNTVELCLAYHWPGNIRELQNIVERSVILCCGETFSIDEAWLSSHGARSPEPSGFLTQSLEAHEKKIIEAALAKCKGRVAGPLGAATRLGIPPSTLDSKIKQFGIRKQKFVAAC